MKYVLTKTELQSEIAVPTADVADNVDVVDVVGNKSDTTAGTSIVSLVKVVDDVVDTISTDVGSKGVGDDLHTKVDTIDGLIDTILATTPRIVSRDAAVIPDTTQTAYFTVTGRVIITQIVGEVTTKVSETATDIKLISNPTVGDEVDLCTALTITSDAVGTMYNITGDFTDAMIATTSGAFTAQSNSFVVAAGTIDLDSTATQTGYTKWTLHYIPLDAGSTVTVTT